MFKYFKLDAKYDTTRRVASTIELTTVELEDYIRKTIFLLEYSGQKYFNCSKVLTELVETQGFPDTKNKEEMRLFKDVFQKVAKSYETYPNHMNNYSFRLKPKPNSILYTFKRLIKP
jgi:hypothetical protein